MPHGPVDLGRQIAIFFLAYYAYRVVRGQMDGSTITAFENARTIIQIEQSLGIFIEPNINAWGSGMRAVSDAASWVYINAQTSVTLGALAWIYLFRNRSFYFVRNMFVVSFAFALVGYLLMPTAPPRFMPEWGFTDSVAEFTGIPSDNTKVSELFNPYAAVPSMHVAFALMIGLPLSRLVNSRPARVFWATYPLVVTFVIVVTANHWIADAVLGALVAGIAALAARSAARTRPEVWSFRAERTTDEVGLVGPQGTLAPVGGRAEILTASAPAGRLRS